MRPAELSGTGHPPLGRLLQHWRRIRKKSQLELALEAGVSARHLCFLETGRSQPSREMLGILSAALDVPLRERNALYVAAGYAPVYRELSLDDEDLAPARRALQLILDRQEPYPAVVMDRHWFLAGANAAARRFFAFLRGGRAAPSPPNIIRMMFDPEGLRPFVENWEAVAEALIQRVHREAVCGAIDPETALLLKEVLTYPGVPARWHTADFSRPPAPFVPVMFRKGELAVQFFSTITTLGTPQDIALQEIRIECFHPANVETESTYAAWSAAQEVP